MAHMFPLPSNNPEKNHIEAGLLPCAGYKVVLSK